MRSRAQGAADACVQNFKLMPTETWAQKNQPRRLRVFWFPLSLSSEPLLPELELLLLPELELELLVELEPLEVEVVLLLLDPIGKACPRTCEIQSALACGY